MAPPTEIGHHVVMDQAARVAREQLKEGLARIVLRQAWTELAVTVRSMSFRRSENSLAVKAYCAMTPSEFEGINARQRWANWRVIPRSLHGRLPGRPCRAIDLCSGLGDSTQVLAYWLPEGSEVLGLEYNGEFAGIARSRPYPNAAGAPARVGFRAQSVLEIFRGVDGDVVPDGSVDLVNSCGALGIHFDAAAIGRIADEISRVLRAGGLATVDSGRAGVDKRRMTAIFASRGFELVGTAKSCFLDRFTHLCFRRPERACACPAPPPLPPRF